MSRGSIADRTRLAAFAARRALHSGAGRLNAHPLLRWRFTPAIADRLLIAPQDLRTADPTRASEIYAGRFAFAGKIVICDGRSPFEVEPPSDEWQDQLLGFGWLRHLRAADSSITRANARALVDEWISLQGSWDNVEAWRPDLVARRIISWLCQAPLVLHDADMRFYRRFLRNLTRQVRYLHRAANATRDGVPRLQAIVALTYAALCMQNQARMLKNVTRKLADELGRQVLPDGGHASRNPGALVELLLDLLPLRQAFSARNVPPPPALNNAIDRMMPMLRFFRHGDGNFALFNGMGPTRTEHVSTVLAYDDARGNPVANAPHSGYQRVQAGDALLVVDAGPPPPPTSRETWRHVARATAAHSTVTFNDTSSCRFLTSESLKSLLGTPILGGPADVQVSRQERDSGVTLRLSHDGYADRFGVVHQRSLRLSADGKRLDGEDLFVPAHGESLPARRGDAFAVRFHLHPTLKANRHSDGHGVMLVLPNKEVWTFDAYEERVDLEESVYLAGPDGPRRAVQIVIHGRAREVPRVHWTFTHQDAQEPMRRALREEPELPL
jgi:uncharacterized heparinase superfamily protein